MRGFLSKSNDTDTNTMNLMCYSGGLEGKGECRFMKTNKRNDLVRGPVIDIGGGVLLLRMFFALFCTIWRVRLK